MPSSSEPSDSSLPSFDDWLSNERVRLCSRASIIVSSPSEKIDTSTSFSSAARISPLLSPTSSPPLSPSSLPEVSASDKPPNELRSDMDDNLLCLTGDLGLSLKLTRTSSGSTAAAPAATPAATAASTPPPCPPSCTAPSAKWRFSSIVSCEREAFKPVSRPSASMHFSRYFSWSTASSLCTSSLVSFTSFRVTSLRSTNRRSAWRTLAPLAPSCAAEKPTSLVPLDNGSRASSPASRSSSMNEVRSADSLEAIAALIDGERVRPLCEVIEAPTGASSSAFEGVPAAVVALTATPSIAASSVAVPPLPTAASSLPAPSPPSALPNESTASCTSGPLNV
mmetsp:Transcript_45144/g.123844  ORF Transcript_45144/g.123844 Transcript_45144/m.123844 type:complete len:338 (-) Transcript_45144:2739-3752(-)